jgi:hypothetical protein
LFEEIFKFRGRHLVINKVLATVLACTTYLASNAVDAAEMKILCASGMREVVSELPGTRRGRRVCRLGPTGQNENERQRERAGMARHNSFSGA